MNYKTLKLVVKNILFPGNRLSQKAISAGIWLGISRISNRALFFIRTILLARLLSPQEFGLFGIALIILSTLQTFSQPGTGEALIQKKEDITSYLNVAWTIKVIRGFLLAIILLILNPFLARFFHEPRTITLLYIISLSLIIGGLGNQGVLYFIKDLQFHKQFIYETISTLIDFIVSLILAFTIRNALALAYGYLAGILALSITSYFLHPYRPHFVVDLAKIKELSRFGRWVWSYTVLGFLLTQGVGFFIAKVLGTTILGLYQMALKLTGVVTTELAAVFGSIGFPLYSKLQKDIYKLREGYSKLLKINCLIITPISFLLLITSKQITFIMLGEKWKELPNLINLLSFCGLFMSISTINNTMLKSVGKPDLTSKIQSFKLLLLAISIFPISIHWGIYGVATLTLSIELIGLPLEFLLLGRKLNVGFFFYAKILLMPILSSFFMFVGLIIINYFFVLNINKTISLLIICIVGILQYFAYSLFFDKMFNYGLINFFNKQSIKRLLNILPS